MYVLPQIFHIFLMNNPYGQGCPFPLRTSGFHTFLMPHLFSSLSIDLHWVWKAFGCWKHNGYSIQKSNFGMKDENYILKVQFCRQVQFLVHSKWHLCHLNNVFHFFNRLPLQPPGIYPCLKIQSFQRHSRRRRKGFQLKVMLLSGAEMLFSLFANAEFGFLHYRRTQSL